MDTLYQFIVDILTKRVPVESPNVKVDQVNTKIILIEVPENINHEDSIEKVMQPAEAPAEGGEGAPAEGQPEM